VSITPARLSGPDAASVPAHRRRLALPRDLIAIIALVVEAAMFEAYLWPLLTRPFYYDEASRAYEIAMGGGFLTHLKTAAAPLSLGWFGIENLARVLLGNTEAGLRAPMFVALPLLGIATYLLARRWLGATASFCIAALLLANGWIVNYALQLKSYSYEGLIAVVTIALYLIIRRSTWRPAQLVGLFAVLGLTCVFSLPNLFVVGPLLALELVRALRDRHQAILRVAGAALAAAIALVHYVAFVAPQSAVAGTPFFVANYAPHRLVPFARFVARGLGSYVPSMLVGIEGGAANKAPKYPLPPIFYGLLVVVILLLLAAGVVVAFRDPAGRALITAITGALLLELLASVVHRWPFGLLRVNIFVLPLLYVLAGIGAAWLGRALFVALRAAWKQPNVTLPRAAVLLAASAVVVVSVAATAVATAGTLAGTRRLEGRPTWFGAVRSAVAEARQTGSPGDVTIIRADRISPDWYAGPWLYYMENYQGFPPTVASRPPIPASNTLAVNTVTTSVIAPFLAKHPDSRVIFLLSYRLQGNIFPQWARQQSLRALAQHGYCSAREIRLPYTGELTIVSRGGCPAGAAAAGG
jgi:hypothetical protein